MPSSVPETEVERSLLQGVVGGEIVVRRRRIGFRRCPEKLDLELFGHRSGDLALDGEDILQLAVVRLGPKRAPIGRIDQFGDDPHSVALFAHAAFEQVRHAQFFANCPAVVGLAFEQERRAAADDLETGNLGEDRDQFLRQAIGKIVIGGVPAGVDQWQHRDRFRIAW